MTTFATRFLGTAWDMLVALHGQAVTYTPFGGSGTSITAMWRPGQMLMGYLPSGTQEVALGVLRASSSDIATPDPRDTVTIQGVVWAVVSIGRRTPVVELQLETRDQRMIGGARHRLEH